jgi:hypothetical protein
MDVGIIYIQMHNKGNVRRKVRMTNILRRREYCPSIGSFMRISHLHYF